MAQEQFLHEPMPDVIAQWRHYFSILQPASGSTIVDVGCNMGDAERLLLREYPAIEKIVGVELNQKRYDGAINKWKQDGAPSQIEFRLADARDLPFSDHSFDRAICAEALEWITPPAKGLQEIKRVLKVGGVAVIVHTDFDTQVFSVQNKLRARNIVQAFSDSGPNGQIGRELYGLCKKAGFSVVEPSVYTLTNTEWRPNLYAYKVAQMMAEWLTHKSLVSQDELEKWLADLERQAQAGVFFYSVNRYICRCLK